MKAGLVALALALSALPAGAHPPDPQVVVAAGTNVVSGVASVEGESSSWRGLLVFHAHLGAAAGTDETAAGAWVLATLFGYFPGYGFCQPPLHRTIPLDDHTVDPDSGGTLKFTIPDVGRVRMTIDLHDPQVPPAYSSGWSAGAACGGPDEHAFRIDTSLVASRQVHTSGSMRGDAGRYVLSDAPFTLAQVARAGTTTLAEDVDPNVFYDPSRWREIKMRWTSEVPSPISRIFASR